MSKRNSIPCSNNLRDRRAVNHDLPPLEQIVRLLGRQAAREALAKITAGQPTNRLSKFHSENGDG